MLDFDNLDVSPDVHAIHADVHAECPDDARAEDRAEDVVVMTHTDLFGLVDDVEPGLTVVADPLPTVQADEDLFAKKLEDDSKL